MRAGLGQALARGAPGWYEAQGGPERVHGAMRAAELLKEMQENGTRRPKGKSHVGEHDMKSQTLSDFRLCA